MRTSPRWTLNWGRCWKAELNRAETRVHYFVELVASGRATPALALRRLTGPVTLTQESPEVGKPYFRAP